LKAASTIEQFVIWPLS